MKHLNLLVLSLILIGANLPAQTNFINKNQLLTPANHYSGVAIAVLDMNGDGMDDIVRMNKGHELAIEFQTAPNDRFSHKDVTSVSNESQWGICAADLDNNGFADILTGGDYDGIKIVTANGDGSAYSMINITQPSTFVQGVNFADINGDGWLDAFVCHDDGTSRVFGNDGTGHLVYQPTWMNLATVPSSDNSGNYGTVWSDIDNDGDLDLYIAKCRQGVNDAADARRINQLFLNNGNGTYTQDISNTAGLRIGAQSWTADFGDIDNDGDFDCFITNHDVSSQLLENDGAGHFTDITPISGLLNQISAIPIQGVFRDFDNDGYVDILVAGGDHYLFHNNGNKTFSEVAGLFTTKPFESFAIGDLNHDGFQDIYAGYGAIYTTPTSNPDILWMNAGNNNHYFGLNLRGVQSNRSAVGAKIILYSALGTQVREVRSGESYGIMNSMQIDFGMGQVTQIDSVIVHWPSGVKDVVLQPAVDQYVTLQEGGCLILAVQATAAGTTTFCSGQSVTLEAPAGYTYLWSNGATTQVITAQDAGSYKVTVAAAAGCEAVSNTINVIVNPVDIPMVTTIGDSVFCAGGSVVLTASPAASYMWSNGATTQSLIVTQAGNYSVATPGLCQAFSSAPTTINVLDGGTPVTTADTVGINLPATLMATGDSVLWYDAPTGGNLLFNGNTYTTIPLAATTTFWAENVANFDQPDQVTGQINHQGGAFGSANFNGSIIFDCLAPFHLSRVKVYTNKAGIRQINLQDDNAQILSSKIVDIPVGTSIVTLDFDIIPGTDLQLTTDEDVNLSTFGTTGPQLRRSDSGVTYPYVIPDVVVIKNSNVDETRYYYFYNWEVAAKGYICTSARIPATALVDSTIVRTVTPEWALDVQLLPNPVTNVLTVAFADVPAGDCTLSVKNAQGRTLQNVFTTATNGAKSTFQTNVAALPAGVYAVTIRTDKGSVTKRFVKM